MPDVLTMNRFFKKNGHAIASSGKIYHYAGDLWIGSFSVDITDYIRPGENSLEIRVTNQWENRLIGDENHPRHDGYERTGYNPKPDSRMPDWYINNEPMPAGPRTTFSSYEFCEQGDELEPSGLKGPVKIKYERVVEISNL